MKTKYYVFDEHTLCYQKPEMNDLGILHTSVLRGSTFDRLQGTFPMPMDTSLLRKATLQDFHDYRVSPKGYDLN